MSHAWQDGHKRKVQMLRAFLCLDALLAQTAVAAVLLAVMLQSSGLPPPLAEERAFWTFCAALRVLYPALLLRGSRCLQRPARRVRGWRACLASAASFRLDCAAC